jgi:hypothetical protein
MQFWNPSPTAKAVLDVSSSAIVSVSRAGITSLALNARAFSGAVEPSTRSLFRQRSCTIRLDSASYHTDLRLLRKKWRISAVLVSNSARASLKGCPPQIFRSTLVGTLVPTNYALAGAAASEYSWCKPPRIDFARTSAPATKRWRDSRFGVTSGFFGGSGTPGPSAL